MESERISDFIKHYTSVTDDFLAELRKDAEEDGVPIIRAETESFLRSIILLIKPRRILELGTATGYSAIFMERTAEGQEPGIELIDTIEDWEPRAAEASRNIAKTDHPEKIHLIKGDAAKIMKSLVGPYDLIFIDAAKGQYPDYLTEAMRLTKKGSVILADNIFQGGEILESKYIVERRDRTIHKRLREYLDRIFADERLATSIVPVGDGMAFSIRRI